MSSKKTVQITFEDYFNGYMSGGLSYDQAKSISEKELWISRLKFIQGAAVEIEDRAITGSPAAPTLADAGRIRDLCTSAIEEIHQECDPFALMNVSMQLGKYMQRTISVQSIQRQLEEVKTTQRRTAPLDALNAAKQDAKRRAQEIAKQLWNADTNKAIRTGEMTDLVWAQLAEDGLSDMRPDTTKSLKDWIKPVAPLYASKGGRSKKPS